MSLQQFQLEKIAAKTLKAQNDLQRWMQRFHGRKLRVPPFETSGRWERVTVFDVDTTYGPPSTHTYDLQGIDDTGLILTDKTPATDRDPALVYMPADVGDVGIVFIQADGTFGSLWLWERPILPLQGFQTDDLKVRMRAGTVLWEDSDLAVAGTEITVTDDATTKIWLAVDDEAGAGSCAFASGAAVPAEPNPPYRKYVLVCTVVAAAGVITTITDNYRGGDLTWPTPGATGTENDDRVYYRLRFGKLTLTYPTGPATAQVTLDPCDIHGTDNGEANEDVYWLADQAVYTLSSTSQIPAGRIVPFCKGEDGEWYVFGTPTRCLDEQGFRYDTATHRFQRRSRDLWVPVFSEYISDTDGWQDDHQALEMDNVLVGVGASSTGLTYRERDNVYVLERDAEGANIEYKTFPEVEVTEYTELSGANRNDVKKDIRVFSDGATSPTTVWTGAECSTNSGEPYGGSGGL